MNYDVAKSRIPLALLSLFIALSLWVYVQAQNDLTSPDVTPYQFELTIQPRNLDTAKLSLARPLGKVRLTANVTQAQQKQINQSNFSAYVDLQGASEGVDAYTVGIAGPLTLSFKYELDRKSIKVYLEAIIEKSIPVKVETRNSPGESGMLYTGSSCEPMSVSVEGPRSYVDQVEHARAVIDLGKVSRGVLITQPVECVDAANESITKVRADPLSVSIKPNLSPAPVTRPVLVNARFEGQPEFGYRIVAERIRVEPSKIAVEGTSEAMARLTGILDTLPISLTGLRATRTFDTSVALPTGLRVHGANTIRVTVVVEGPSVGNGG